MCTRLGSQSSDQNIQGSKSKYFKSYMLNLIRIKISHGSKKKKKKPPKGFIPALFETKNFE